MNKPRSITFSATVGNDGEHFQFDDVSGIECDGVLYPDEILVDDLNCEQGKRCEFTITVTEVSDG